MTYRKCPRCDINYIKESEEFCKVCLDEMAGIRDDLDEEEKIICPLCYRNTMNFDDVMCHSCAEKRYKDKQNLDD
ncbi:MAG: hypothetical protein RR086_01280 [Clostridia bacterium]